MPKTVTYDSLKTTGTNVWVDGSTGAVKLESNYRLIASATGEQVHRSKVITHLLNTAFNVSALPANPTRRDVVMLLAQGLEAALATEELG